MMSRKPRANVNPDLLETLEDKEKNDEMILDQLRGEHLYPDDTIDLINHCDKTTLFSLNDTIDLALEPRHAVTPQNRSFPLVHPLARCHISSTSILAGEITHRNSPHATASTLGRESTERIRRHSPASIFGRTNTDRKPQNYPPPPPGTLLLTGIAHIPLPPSSAEQILTGTAEIP